MSAKRVTVGDLKYQTGIPGLRVFLWCRKCGAENSGDRGDYFQLPVGYVFRCCRRNMVLATKHMIYNVVKG